MTRPCRCRAGRGAQRSDRAAPTIAICGNIEIERMTPEDAEAAADVEAGERVGGQQPKTRPIRVVLPATINEFTHVEVELLDRRRRCGSARAWPGPARVRRSSRSARGPCWNAVQQLPQKRADRPERRSAARRRKAAARRAAAAGTRGGLRRPSMLRTRRSLRIRKTPKPRAISTSVRNIAVAIVEP